MRTRLIINADDFGLTTGVNRSVGELYRAGVLSSATLMANGRAFDDAIRLAKELPALGVGCHVVLTDGQPLSEPDSIATLLGPDGQRLRPSLGAFARAALLGRLDEKQIEHEASLQIQRLLDAGIHPTHLDTHKHTHMFPAVLRPLLRVAGYFGINAIRNPFEQPWSLGVGRGRFLRRLQIRALGTMERQFHTQIERSGSGVTTTRGAIGVSATGDLDHATLTALLAKLPEGTWEFVCHPGYSDRDLDQVTTRLRSQREVERKALLQVLPKAMAGTRRFDLISFAALSKADA